MCYPPPSIFTPNNCGTAFVFYLPFRGFIKKSDFTQEIDCYSAWIILAESTLCLLFLHSCNCYMDICSIVLQRNIGFAGKAIFFERAQQYLLWKKKKVLIFYLIQLSKITAFLCSHLNIILWFFRHYLTG